MRLRGRLRRSGGDAWATGSDAVSGLLPVGSCPTGGNAVSGALLVPVSRDPSISGNAFAHEQFGGPFSDTDSEQAVAFGPGRNRVWSVSCLSIYRVLLCANLRVILGALCALA